MAKNQFENIWSELRNIDFTLENEISNKFKCIICQKLLMEAQSGPCGCIYCLECIRQYLNGKEKFCPGETDECKEALVNFDKDVHVDQRMNIKLLKLIVKCPDKSCQYREQLKSIPDHMRMSNHQLIYSRCPYCDIGCREERVVKDELFTHLNSEILSHSSLMTQWMNNLTNEVASLKNEGENLRNESCFLKEEIRDLKADNEERDVRDERKGIEICELQTKLEEKIVEIDQLRGDLQQDSIKLKENQEACHKHLVALGISAHKIDCLDKRIDGIDETKRNVNRKLSEIKKSQNKNFCGQIFLDYDDWVSMVVTNFDHDVYKVSCSEPFFSLDGYKMCLELRSNRNSLLVSVSIMRGSNDDKLIWPCTHDITIDFVLDASEEVLKSKTWKYDGSPKDRKRPTSDKNSALSEYLKIYDLKEFLRSSLKKQFSISCVLYKSSI